MRFKLSDRQGVLLYMLAVVGAIWCYYWYQSATLRLRMTVTVDDNGVERVGSSVMEIKYWKQFQFMLEIRPYGTNYRYQATPVDLVEKGYFFALVQTSSNDNGFYLGSVISDYMKIYKIIDFTDDIKQAVEALKALGPKTKVTIQRGFRDLAGRKVPLRYPVLVCFKDPKDYTTLQVLDPADLTPCFGPGVALTSVSIEVTDDPVIDLHVEKLVNLSAPTGWFGAMSNTDLRRAIFPDNFKQGVP